MTAQTVVEGELNLFQRGVQFLREVQAELKKVTWPNQKQTAGATVVVIILVFIIATFLGLVDVTLSKLVQIVLA
ncbi:MAG: preprotein translocase subunit SecE [Desulfamplus sp.]|nr:preprotein translocase subunit SecE [Desulfamplus sp.]